MTLTHVPVAPLSPERFKQILDADQSAELDHTIERAEEAFGGRVVWSVNSTARGGGVAEMLHSLIAYVISPADRSNAGNRSARVEITVGASTRKSLSCARSRRK